LVAVVNAAAQAAKWMRARRQPKIRRAVALKRRGIRAVLKATTATARWSPTSSSNGDTGA
jgi:hypothetical protein